MKHVLPLLALACASISLAQPSLPLDYSIVGYHQSELPIPSAPVAAYVEPQGADHTAAIQQALDYVASLKADPKTGLRGAVLLDSGTYVVSQPLRIASSGVVLRGMGPRRTVILRKGTAREAVVYIEGINDRVVTDTFSLTSYHPAGAVRLDELPAHVSGDVLVWRPSTKEWIEHLGCDTWGGGSRLGYWAWHPGEIDVFWDRTVSAQTLSAPLSAPLDPQWAPSKVLAYTWPGRISDSGVEYLSLVSDFDPARPLDEDHAWQGVSIDCARDCWVRGVTFRHLAGSAVYVGRNASRVSVEDCKALAPVSEIGGMRRRTFFTLGGQTLFLRCFSEEGINDFAAGQCAPGPNAFVQCDTRLSHGPSGSIGPWATGLLFDGVNIDGNDLRFANLELEKYGAGWNTAASTLWQSTAAAIHCYSPDSDAVNIAYGCWAQFLGNGVIEQTNEHVKPWSLFEALLLKRRGDDARDEVASLCRTLERDVNASSSPTIEEALRLAAEAWKPRLTLEAWIDSLEISAPLSPGKARHFTASVAPVAAPSAPTVTLKNGRLIDISTGALLVGGRHNSPWWNGRLRYSATDKATYALTRFVPGSESNGTTTRIDSVVALMEREHTLLYAQNYGLWYDRRRDDHERVRRRDGDVWGPFYEQPFQRSGEGTAWDGLSRYDLTRLNPWYYDRLTAFAAKGAPRGLLLLQQHYFQHNIIEAGAHWVDCPWRTANNLNDTPFLEPVPFTGDKRIFTAEQFYDVTNPTLRALHRQYIKQTLSAFKAHSNVIHSIGEEFTGPLSFVEFWLDCIAEWEAENGQRVLVALTVNKDVQDSILADERRAAVVDIIGIEQWFYHAKGLYAPPGGVSMAPRQYQRKIRTGSARFEDVYRAVSDYRRQCPDKAVAYYAQKYPELAWAVVMAGGSLPALSVSNKPLLQSLAAMQPAPSPQEGTYVLEGAGATLYYKESGEPLAVTLPKGSRLYRVDARSGACTLLSKQAGPQELGGKGIFWMTQTNVNNKER